MALSHIIPGYNLGYVAPSISNAKLASPMVPCLKPFLACPSPLFISHMRTGTLLIEWEGERKLSVGSFMLYRNKMNFMEALPTAIFYKMLFYNLEEHS